MSEKREWIRDPRAFLWNLSGEGNRCTQPVEGADGFGSLVLFEKWKRAEERELNSGVPASEDVFS